MMKPAVAAFRNSSCRFLSAGIGAAHEYPAGGFELSDEHKMLRSAVKKFVQEEIVPVAAHYDKRMEFPWDVLRKIHANGYMNLDIPAEYGGHRMDLLSNILVSEITSYGCSSVGVTLGAHDLATTPLINHGSEAVKKEYLGRLTAEPLLASFACTEPDAGSDISRITTKAVKKGDEWVINGTKCWITNAGLANWFFVLARTDPDPKVPIHKAFTGFVVDADASGVSVGKKEINLGQRASDTRSITFEDLRIPDSQRIGGIGHGGNMSLQSFHKTRPHAAAFALGVAARALDEAAKYSLERKTFGVPISQHQAVCFMLADMAKNLELARMMVYRSAIEVGKGSPEGVYWASIGKLFAADTAMEAAVNAVQIFGGNGFSSEYPVEKLLRDAKVTQIYEGTSQIQRIVIGRELLKRVKEIGSASFW